MSFLVPFVVFLKIGPFQCHPIFFIQCFLPCFPTNLCLKYKIFLTLMPLTSPMYFLMPLVSFDIIWKAFNPQPFAGPPLPKKKFFMLNLVPLVFLICLFDTHVKLFVVLLSFLIENFIYLLFVIFHHPWCCLNVFLLLKKFRSSLNQNTPPNQIFIKEV